MDLESATNMPSCDSKATAAIRRSSSVREGGLLFIDLDNFKAINDALGHAVGDNLLRQVAERLLACVRKTETVARLGGDEFVVMVEDLSPDVGEAARQMEAMGTKILSALNQPYVLAGRNYQNTPSIGITLFGSENSSADELMKRADIAMYQAKRPLSQRGTAPEERTLT